jgi:hypothetical protein
MDFHALPTMRHKAAYLNQLVFPNPEYMRWKYPDAGQSPMAWLYARRSYEGIVKRLKPRG